MTQVEKHTKSTYRVIRNTLVLSVCEFHGTQGFYVGAVELVPCVPSIGTQEKELGYGCQTQPKVRTPREQRGFSLVHRF